MIVLGIDSGTQSTKCIALDAESGEILATAREAYDLIPGLPTGHMEQHPTDWADACEKVIESCLDALGGRRGEVVAIGVSGQQHGLVVLDAQDKVVRPAKLWCDTSTSSQCAVLEERLGGRSGAIAACGNAMLPGYTAPKILWLKENEPANYAATRSILLPHDWLNFFLTGRKCMEYGDASGTALMNVHTREWSPEVLLAIGAELGDKLPPLQSSLKPAGELRAEWLEKWGLKGPVIVSAGGGDNMMGAIGSGNLSGETFTVSLGTSGTLYACSKKPVVDPNGEIAAFCDSTDHWLPLVCTMNVTVATEKVRELFHWDHDQLESAVDSVAPGSEGLKFLPYLNGERTPDLPSGCGVFHGLKMHNFQASQMARAVMEGVTLGLAYGAARFRALGLPPKGIRLTGGGSNSKVWRQMMADVFGAETVCLQSAEGAALGGAIQALWTWNSLNNGGDSMSQLAERLVPLDPNSLCTPSAERVDFYADLLNEFTSLSQKMHGTGLI